MEKETLLNAIEENKSEHDEREGLIKISSYTWAYSGGYTVLLVLMFFRMLGDKSFVSDLMMILMGQMSFMTLYLYINNKEKKSNLYFFILTVLLFLGFTYSTMVYYGLI